ncbi:class II aldolase/adducin family protein [Candidatus Latescibacterota bacterium]
MKDRERDIREQICEVGRRMWIRGWVAANNGNMSMRFGDDGVIITPTGVSKGFMTPDMLVEIDLDGTIQSGYLKPSLEIKIHLEAYRRREDVRGFVHAHPPVATGFAVTGIPLDFSTLPEIIVSLGEIPLARYGTPSTTEPVDSISELIVNHDAVLLANHGVITLGRDVLEAYYRMEMVEHFAKISLTARQLGGMKTLTGEQIEKLLEIHQKLDSANQHGMDPDTVN